MTTKDMQIWAEMARRKKQFHPDEEWTKIKLWGLFDWRYVSHLIESGDLVTHMKKENKTIWVIPSSEAYHKFIEPLLIHSIPVLTKMAGY